MKKAPLAAAPRLAYLLSQYPAVSHTFLRDEINGLRQLGFTIETASINAAYAAHTGEDGAAVSSTFYVKPTPATRALGLAFRTLFSHPGVFFRGLRAAFTGAGLDAWRILYAAFYFLEGLLVADWLRQRNLRHLHIHFGGPVATVGRIAARAARIPYSLTIHGPDEFFNENKFILRQKVEQAAFVFCISNYCRGQLMRIAAPQHWPRLHVARLGVNCDLFAARTPRSLAVPVQLLCVGRLVAAKGQRVLLDACRLLAERGHLLHVTFVGTGPDEAGLKTHAAVLGLGASVHFTGALSHAEIRARLSEADVFVLPSFAEGIPVALMEAMAVQLACVSTWTAGIPELIIPDVDGLLVPPGSPSALADALEQLLADPQLRAQLGLSARQRVLAAYSQRENLAITAGLLRENLSGDIL
ncbi:MAG: glycosyltransferase family 4 protein [Acidobacteriaceae bacterium]|nr:glycosyltransferase family 4 protein [Acidobacteriaceae bacterium]